MIKICKDFREVSKYRKFSLLKQGVDSISVLVLDKKLFARARQLFAAGHVLIEVRKSSGEVVFYLKMYHDMIDSGNANVDVDINFNGCDLLKEKNLDPTLLEKSKCFVFEQLEEYTFELTEYIIKKYPDAQIFYLDRNAKYFWGGHEGVTVLNSIYEIDSFWANKYMFICSDIKRHEHMIPEGVSLMYNSENVLNSLCWARKVDNRGSKNSDKVILLIDMEFDKGCGLAYIVRAVCTFACMAHERGWIPVVKLTGSNMYIDSPSDNMWEQYFLPLSDVSVEDALESQNVISLKNNHLSYKVIHINPYFREIWEFPQKHPQLEFNNDVKEYFNTYMPQEIREKKHTVLGVLIRGTDASVAAKAREEIDFIVSECQEIMEDNGFERVFLATEDAVYFEAFKKAFQEKLVFIEQKRVAACEQVWKPVGELLDIQTGEKKNFGQKYLLATNCLAQCQALVYNAASGGYYLTNMQRRKPYDFSYHLNIRETELDYVIKCLEMVESNDITAIYGTGIMGKRILNIMGQRNEAKIVFCDTKAENGEYQFGHFRVIAPLQLLQEYEKKKIQGIIIATVRYKEEIYHSLIRNGVNPEHVLCIENRGGVL